uniref:Protein kinase domain-containing protein n=1 Tax=Brassica oleracea TaxID=3712 RepID=A0A3P6C2P2_BRAOL|nr:unnamed protein product [Brassica oleracea]
MKLNDFSLNTLISLTSGEAPPTKRRCTSTAQVSLLRFWEDRNVKRDGEGQHSPHGRQGIFSLLVKCTLLAALSCPDFKLSDSPVSIRLNIETGLKDLTDPGSNSSRTFQEHGLTESFLRACPIGIMPDGSGGGGGLREETAENESCLADVEVKLLEFDAMIKKLSRRRPGQLIKTIAFLEDLHLYILHTYMTTMEQTVLYSFNVKARIFTQLTSKLACSVSEHTGRSVPPVSFFCRANVSENERRTGLYDYQLSGCLTDQTSEYAPRGKPMEHPRFNTYHTCKEKVKSFTLFVVSTYAYFKVYLEKNVQAAVKKLDCGNDEAAKEFKVVIQIIHRDLKSSNIFLDCNFNAKISDFGLAVVNGPKKKNLKLSGTVGYVAPLSSRRPIDAFGVVLLELLHGKKKL